MAISPYSRLIQIWGAVDLCYVLWVIYADLSSGRMPFVDSFVDAMNASFAFGSLPITLATIAGALVHLTVIASGLLMIMLRRIGVYLSILQAPFRVFLSVPPTLFFISAAASRFPAWIILGTIIGVETFKLVTEILWLRHRSKDLAEGRSV